MLRRAVTTSVLTAGLALAAVAVPGPGQASASRACPPVAAHRGASGVHGENTVPGHRYAYRHGVPWVEADLRYTRDGKAMAMHDETLNRTTTGHGYIHRRTARYVRRHRTDDGPRVPYLTQVLRNASRHGGSLILDVKPRLTRRQTAHLVGRVREFRMARRVVVASFDPRNLRRVEAKAPRLVTARWDPVGSFDATVVSGPWDVYAPTRRAATPTAAQVTAAHDMGVQVMVGGRNTRDEWAELTWKGVDRLVSDAPFAYRSWAAEGLCGLPPAEEEPEEPGEPGDEPGEPQEPGEPEDPGADPEDDGGAPDDGEQGAGDPASDEA